jgi:hypothetical protein
MEATMLDGIIQQLAGGNVDNIPNDQLHNHLDSLLGAASQGHVAGAVSDALGNLGPDGFASSVASAAQGQGPNERGQLGSMLLHAIEQGGGNPGGVLGSLGIGAQNPQNMSHGDLGSLAGYVASNYGGALSGLLGSAAGGSGGGGNSMASDAMHLLGNPMVQQTALHLAQRFLHM